jgi:hypothetical protein
MILAIVYCARIYTLGVMLVRQVGDAALGEFDEPIILLKLGKVPEAD